MPAKKRRNYLLYIGLVFLVLLGIFELFLIVNRIDKKVSGSSSSQTSQTTTQNGNSTPEFNKNLYSVDESASLWVVVNKGRVLPSTYVPEGLVVPNIPLRLGASSSEMHIRSDAAAALEQMADDAKNQGINLMLASGYRSYSNQVATYAGFVKQSGQAAADTYSARPGHSEHQSGLAADLEPTSRKCEVQDCFADTPEGKWLAVNSYKYGFIIRYQKNNESLTGYQYEPWHVRYVGVDLAAQINRTGQTLEQFFGLPSYTNYPSQPYQLK